MDYRFYEILEGSPDASSDDIKKQYRFLINAYHPDKFRSIDQKTKAEEKVKGINEAFDILSNTEKRAKYDRERLTNFSREQGNQKTNQGTPKSYSETRSVKEFGFAKLQARGGYGRH